MKNSEDAITKVLAGLRDSPAPTGMERRILKALEDPANLRTRSRWRWLSIPGYRTPAACSLALAAVGAVILTLIGPPRRPPAKQADTQRNSHTANLHSAKESAGEVPNTQTTGAATRSLCSKRHGKMPHIRTTADADAAESAAIRPANIPPPPMPLTRQERLLLQIARVQPHVQLAELSSARRAAQDE
ncbi:hypothetical protein [Edaphobacter modestus]|uniref:Uncharacterized protein n=1 Tax=Edaphobacter modestus TaxID=388466 RepID=A0A4V2G4Q4_9BACT|nr:hypothetical protein [Edaphobacter modestus]RZU41866.1 hypothetical protein BDD14_3403 [Edaphobacter modestus]